MYVFFYLRKAILASAKGENKSVIKHNQKVKTFLLAYTKGER